jgi:hypothetical protein
MHLYGRDICGIQHGRTQQMGRERRRGGRPCPLVTPSWYNPAMSVHNPHDRFFRESFSRPEIVRNYLERVSREELEQALLAQGAPGEKLMETIADEYIQLGVERGLKQGLDKGWNGVFSVSCSGVSARCRQTYRGDWRNCRR